MVLHSMRRGVWVSNTKKLKNEKKKGMDTKERSFMVEGMFLFLTSLSLLSKKRWGKMSRDSPIITHRHSFYSVNQLLSQTINPSVSKTISQLVNQSINQSVKIPPLLSKSISQYKRTPTCSLNPFYSHLAFSARTRLSRWQRLLRTALNAAYQ